MLCDPNEEPRDSLTDCCVADASGDADDGVADGAADGVADGVADGGASIVGSSPTLNVELRRGGRGTVDSPCCRLPGCLAALS